MRIFVFLLACILAVVVLPVSAVEFQRVEFQGKAFTVCYVHVMGENLQLFRLDDAGEPFLRFDSLAAWTMARKQKLVFAMNGGMYHGDFSPVGLFVAGGKQFAPLNTDKGEGNFFLQPNGVFLVTARGARVIETSEYPAVRERVTLATQSGPLLLRAGRIHSAFRSNSESRLFRNGVGVADESQAIFVISEEPVNFHEFATFFRDGLRCPDALFLDGTISSLYSPELGRNDFRMDLGPILAVTEGVQKP